MNQVQRPLSVRRRYHIAQLKKNPVLCVELAKETPDPVVRAYYLHLAVDRLLEERALAVRSANRYMVALTMLGAVAGALFGYLWMM